MAGASATGNTHLINNRQGGRRRGRGGQRPQGMSGNPGNTRDNRQRGNAAQLLEKYKSLARDAQLVGDRVQTEYYLQYADHYFRVLEDSRSRFEEQQAQRRPRREDEEDDVDGDQEMNAESDGEDEDGETEVRQRPQQRRDRPERPQRERFATDRGDRPQRERANGARRDEDEEGEERISLGVLPPSIGAAGDDGEEEAPKPRRRAARKPKAEDDDIAPAA